MLLLLLRNWFDRTYQGSFLRSVCDVDRLIIKDGCPKKLQVNIDASSLVKPLFSKSLSVIANNFFVKTDITSRRRSHRQLNATLSNQDRFSSAMFVIRVRGQKWM